MSRKKRMQNIRETKDRRMKRVAAGGVVLLVIVLGFELSSHLGGGSKSSPAATTTTSAPVSGSPAPTAAPTEPGVAAAAILPATSTRLPNSDVAPTAGKSQLHSLSHFAGKNPFVQQVNAAAAGSPPAGSTSGGAPAANPPKGAGSGSGSGSQGSPPRHLASASLARIAINGKTQVVRADVSFPSANPLFRVVSLGNGAARIGLVSGTFASGARTVSLRAGQSLTLVDNTDGVRYTLRLISLS